MWKIMGWISVAWVLLGVISTVGDDKQDGKVRIGSVIFGSIAVAYLLHSLLT
jgi:hypothetical protein